MLVRTRRPIDKPVSAHFNSSDHDLRHLSIMVLEVMTSPNEKNAEMMWIFQLQSLHPGGIIMILNFSCPFSSLSLTLSHSLVLLFITFYCFFNFLPFLYFLLTKYIPSLSAVVLASL